MIVLKEEGHMAREIADMIRQCSEAGQLLSESQILGRVAGQVSLTWPLADPAEKIGNVVKDVVGKYEDVRLLTAQDGTRRYYSSQFMTQAYAEILLQKGSSHLRLIAEIVRQNSELYPRPVPMDLFTLPPFDLTGQEVRNAVERMAAGEEYRDIVPTTTSASRVFLYSTLHLEPDHASMLAEWLDVGQLNNP